MQCILCQSVKARTIRPYLSPIDGQCYTLQQCEACGFEFWEPRPQLSSLYEGESIDEYRLFHTGGRVLRQSQQQFFVRWANWHKGRLLDVGCGNGYFLSLAEKHGLKVTGLDFDRRSVEAAQRRYELDRVFAMPLDEFCAFSRQEGHPYQIISFFEVLEHQADPVGFIHAISGMLDKGGVVLGSVPNAERFFAWMDRSDRTEDWPPHHLTYWSVGTLRRLFRQAGFDKVSVTPVQRASGRLLLKRLLARGSSSRSPGDQPAPSPSKTPNILFRLGHSLLETYLGALMTSRAGAASPLRRLGLVLYFEARRNG